MSSQNPDLSGRTIGEYEIVKRVGVGGMGEVYEGRHPLIGKRVAVKVLLPSLSNEAELVERFLAEARAVNEIRHRGIVDIFSFGQLPEGSRYFVMEFLDGEAFDKIIKRRSPLPMGEVLGWAEEMLDALEAAHSAGIIHRDIKPSNLFLVNTGRGRPYVKLLDFGIAKLGAINGEATPQTRASVILGTPDYISPEQARGKSISPQTDLYALGCVLFEMLTGERVFRGENTLQTMWMHVEDTPPTPSSIRPDIPPELDQLILWALEKESANRPPSALVMRDQLAVIKNQLSPTGQFTPPPITGSGHRPIATTPPPSGRNKVVAGTPAPRSGSQAVVKTPSPASRSGGQAPISTRTRVQPATSGGLSGETRLSPIPTGPQPVLVEPPAPEPEVESAPGFTQPELAPVAPKSKLPLVLAAAVGVLVIAVIVFVAMGSQGTQNDPPVPVPVAEVPPRDPVKVEPPKIDPVAKVDPVPTKVEPVAKVDPVVKVDPVPKVDPPKVDPQPTKVEPVKPKARVITNDQLVARLRKIEAQLASREAETGQKDNVMRQFIEQGRKEIQKSTNDSDRKAAWSFLGDIEAQLKR